MTPPPAIWFLRAGRKRRARGLVVETSHGLTKVLPTAKGWRHLWVTPAEIAAATRMEQPKLKLR